MGREMLSSIRLDERSIEEILNRLDMDAPGAGAERREGARFAYRVKACVVQLQQPGDSEPASFLVPTRNVSSGGLSFLHGGFVHVGTSCTARLVTRHGKWNDEQGVVTRCRHVEGTVHEVGIRFKSRIEPSAYCQLAIRHRVLLADDDEMLARMTRQLLRQMNADVDHMNDGMSAAAAALREPYDIVLMEVESPAINGLEAVAKLRREAYTGFIAGVTTETGPDAQERCITAGCDHYLAKPLSKKCFQELFALLDHEPLISTLRGDSTLAGLIEAFVDELPGVLRDLEIACREHDALHLEQGSRLLKGNSGCYGFAPISEAAERLESMARAHERWDRIYLDMRKLAQLCMLARTSVRIA